MASRNHAHDADSPDQRDRRGGGATRLDVAPEPLAKRRALDRLVADAESAGYSTAAVFAVRLAVEEALTNAIAHGHAKLPGEPVSIVWSVTPDRIDVEVIDRGPGFDPGDAPDPTLDENLEKPAGRGLMLMRAYMTRVDFNERGNAVSMTFERPPAREREPRPLT